MRSRAFCLAAGSAVLLTVFATQGFSRVQGGQTRIPQQIVINGQTVNGAIVVASGGQVQSFTCSSPQHYVTADSASQGWACYEEASGVWLLSALPPAQAQAPPAPLPVPQQPQVQQPQPQTQQGAVIYPQAPPPVVYPQAPPAVVYPQATVVYPQPTVVYQQPPTVIYQAPPTVVYQQVPPTVVYTPTPTVVVGPAYPSSVLLGTAAINAAGRIASAAIISSHYPRYYYGNGNGYYNGYGYGRGDGRGYGHGRR